MEELLQLRWTTQQKERLRKAARAAGKPISQYVRDAVTKQLRDDEDRALARRRDNREEREARRASTGPVGLFRNPIAAFGKRDNSADAPPAPTVTVNVGQGSDGHFDLGQLAAYVVDARPGEREARLESVAKLLAHGRSPEDAQARAKALDEAIERLDHQKRERPQEQGGALSRAIARIVGAR